uniref:THAP-type domain-containing protein n=1 Tax=Magallana gigas TaxID=29159 RepID=A0A8W8LJC8_MAGGI
MPETCCCVPGCSNRGGHVFPSDQLRKKAWIHAIRRGESRFQSWEPSSHAVVCRSHFQNSDYLSETVYGTTIKQTPEKNSNSKHFPVDRSCKSRRYC